MVRSLSVKRRCLDKQRQIAETLAAERKGYDDEADADDDPEGRRKAHGQIFSSSTANALIANELAAVIECSTREAWFVEDPTDDDVRVWTIKLYFHNEEPGSALARRLQELAACYGYPYVELRLTFQPDLFPFYPCELVLVRPRFFGIVMQALADLPFLRLNGWDPTQSMISICQSIKGAIRARGDLLDASHPRNDPVAHPGGAYTSLEYALAALARASATTPLSKVLQPHLFEDGGGGGGVEGSPLPSRMARPLTAGGVAEASSSKATPSGPGSTAKTTPMSGSSGGRAKGTGYSGDGGGRRDGSRPVAWDTARYEAAEARREEETDRLLRCVLESIAGGGVGDAPVTLPSLLLHFTPHVPPISGDPPQSFLINAVAGSCLPPLVAARLTEATFSHVARRPRLYATLMCLLRTLASRPALAPCLGPLPGMSPSCPSMAAALKALHGQVKIFLASLFKHRPGGGASTARGGAARSSDASGEAATAARLAALEHFLGGGPPEYAGDAAGDALAAAVTAAAAGGPPSRNAGGTTTLAHVEAEDFAWDMEETTAAVNAAIATLTVSPAAAAGTVAPLVPAAPASGDPESTRRRRSGRLADKGRSHGVVAMEMDEPATAVTSFVPAAAVVPPLPPEAAEAMYKASLEDVAFDQADMEWGHAYAAGTGATGAGASAASAGGRERRVRLAEEAASLSRSLPLSRSSSIFLRLDDSRNDLMRAVITGPEDTPYSGGCFAFDIGFPANYPHVPPHVKLLTTGAGSVRFNPNLYNCGKVCLSLLGTWSGGAGESWDPKVSSVWQVLLSIQSLILVPDPYFNEPGHQQSANTPTGDVASRDYNEVIRAATLRFAMLGALRDPPAGFDQPIKRHFKERGADLVAQCRTWVAQATAPSRKSAMESDLTALSSLIAALS